MKPGSWQTLVFHAAGAAVFFFALQKLVLKADTMTSLVWAIAGAAGAAWLAWYQANR